MCNKYDQLLSSTVDNALLHLWMKVSTSKQFVPTKTRNEWLLKYFKPKVKDTKYKLIKNDLKIMLRIARHPNGDLEKRLNELHDLSDKHLRSDVQTLYSWLNWIFDEHDIESKLWEETEERHEGVLYMRREDFLETFSDSNQQIAPVPMFLQHRDALSLFELIKKDDAIHLEANRFDEETQELSVLVSTKRFHERNSQPEEKSKEELDFCT